MTTFHIDANGNQLRATSDPDAVIPGAVTKTQIAPESGKQRWNGTGWDALPVALPEDTALTLEDVERLLRAVGVTPTQIAQARRDRGKPVP